MTTSPRPLETPATLGGFLDCWRAVAPVETSLRRTLLRRRLSFRLPLEHGSVEIRFAGRSAKWLAARAVRHGGMHEPGTVRALIALRTLLGPGRAPVFDVGYLHGYVSLLAAAILDAPWVHGFEMNSAYLALARRNLSINPALAPRIRLFSAAVAAETRSGVPCAVRNYTLRIDPPDLPDGFRWASVDLVTLDDHSAREDAVPGVIKIDVEGAQMSVLRGADRLLREARPILLIETDGPGAANFEGDSMAALCDLLVGTCGYDAAFVNHRRWDVEPAVLGTGAADIERNGLLICVPGATPP